MRLPWENRNPSMEDFLTQNWNNLSQKERLYSLQYYENTLAEEQGRVARKVSIKPDAEMEGAFGKYNYKEPTYFSINRNFLKNKDNTCTDWNSYNALKTVAHEGRHAYQDDCIMGRIDGRSAGISAKQLEIWRKNRIAYIECEVVEKLFLKYRFQPLEEDANNYGQKEIEILQSHYNGDLNYVHFLEKAKTDNRVYEIRAEEVYGRYFKQTIEKEIDDEYRLKKAANYGEEPTLMKGDFNPVEQVLLKEYGGQCLEGSKESLDSKITDATTRYAEPSLENLDSMKKINVPRKEKGNQHAVDTGGGTNKTSGKDGFRM